MFLVLIFKIRVTSISIIMFICFGFIILQDIQEAHAGQIVAVFGVDCASGLSFTQRISTQNLFVIFIYKKIQTAFWYFAMITMTQIVVMPYF